jgi:DNA-binding IclR family transcriptional regulator
MGDQADVVRLEQVIDGRQGIQSVEIAMHVLEALESAGTPRSLTQIGADTGMQPSKVHRYLVSLSRAGLVSQNRPSGLYDLGPALRRLGAEALRRVDEVALVSEHLPRLRDRTRHAANITVWGENGPVVVRFDYGSYPLPITVRVGATLPLTTTSAGRVFLTYLPEAVTDPLIRTLEAGLASEIAKIKQDVREHGYALTFDAMIPQVCSVAAPVFSSTSLPLAVALVMPNQCATEQELTQVTAELLSATAEMSADLGYVADSGA